MNNREAITLLRNLEDSLDSYCELNEEGKTVFCMAIEALNCSEFPNNSDTISRQAAIDAFDGTKVDEEDCTEYDIGYNDGIDFAVSKLSVLPSAQPEQQWIPCSKRLPEEESKKYWVCTDQGYQHECRWTNVNPIWTNLTTDWHWNRFDIPQYSKVIAWMPLPEPYKEG